MKRTNVSVRGAGKVEKKETRVITTQDARVFPYLTMYRWNHSGKTRTG